MLEASSFAWTDLCLTLPKELTDRDTIAGPTTEVSAALETAAARARSKGGRVARCGTPAQDDGPDGPEGVRANRTGPRNADARPSRRIAATDSSTENRQDLAVPKRSNR